MAIPFHERCNPVIDGHLIFDEPLPLELVESREVSLGKYVGKKVLP
jgi:hypothetical protein